MTLEMWSELFLKAAIYLFVLVLIWFFFGD